MKPIFISVVFMVLLVLPLLAFAISEQWCYAQNHNSGETVQTDQLVIFFEGFSPQDFYAHNHPYTITEVEFYVYGWESTGSSTLNLRAYLIPDKYTSPSGLTSPIYSTEGLTFGWIEGEETLNGYLLNWGDFSGGQCVGIAVGFPNGMYHGYLWDFWMVGDWLVPKDTGDWCYDQMDDPRGWRPYEDDYSIAVTVSFDNSSVNQLSLGKIKALLE
jgi:hypothetical protein